MHATIAGVVASAGYPLLFALIAVESFGIPLPGETALVSAAAYAALGRLNIALVIGAAALGAIVGDNAGYVLGRKGGIALVRRYGRRVGLTERKLEKAHAFFERHGGKTVFIGRFVALLRSWAAALAGVACMSYGRFMAYNAAGGIAWAVTFGTLGYLFGHNLPRLHRYAGQASAAAVLLVALAVLVGLGMRWFHARRDHLAAMVRHAARRVARSRPVSAVRRRHPRAWSFATARFARGEYLGLHLTIGIIVSIAALWLFGGVTEDVVHNDPLTVVDVRVAAWFRLHATPFLDGVGVGLSRFGSPPVMGGMMIAVALVLAFRRWWVVLAGWLAAFAGAALLTTDIKAILHRSRPLGFAQFYHGASFSFPSGHALGSLVGFGMLAYLLIAFWAPAHRHRWLVMSLAFALVLGVGLSRLYLGVHYVSDVIAGFAAGLVWLAACVTGIEIALRQRGLNPWHAQTEPTPAASATDPAAERPPGRDRNGQHAGDRDRARERARRSRL